MSTNDKGLTVKLGFELDKSGAEEAKETVTEVRETVAEAEQTAAQETTAANQAAASSTREATAADERALYAAQLSLKNKKELAKEYKNLNAQRKAAAAAKDTQAYQKLTAQMGLCKKAMKDLAAAKKMNQIAALGQAQTAASLAGQIGSLSQQVRSGSTDFAGMAMQIYSIGTAIKALGGPIGWVMLAVQGLQMAFEAWLGNEQEEMEKSIEANKAYMEQRQKTVDFLNDLKKEGNDNEFNRLQKRIETEQAAIKKNAEEKQRLADVQAQREDDAATARMDSIKRELDAEKLKLDLAEQRGEMTKAEAEEARRAAEDKAQAETDAIKKGLDDAKAAREEFSAELATNTATELAKTLKDVDPLLTVKLPPAAEYDELIKRLEVMDEDEEKDEIKRKREGIDKQIADLKKTLKQLCPAFEGSPKEVLEFIDRIRELKKNTDESVEAAQGEATAHKDAAETERQNAEAARKAEGETKSNLDLQRKLADDKTARDNATKAREEAWSEKQKQSLDEQEKWLKETSAGLQQGSEEAKKWAKELRNVQAKQQAEKLANEIAAREEEWAEVQRKTLDEQQEWLEKTGASLKEGSKEAKRWAKELRNVEAKKIGEELSSITKDLETVGNYSAEDKRTQAEIYAADEKTLDKTAERLAKLKATPNLDAATMAAINDQQRKVRAAMQNLRATVQRGANEAQKAVEGIKPQKIKASAGHAQGNLDRAAKNFATLAQRAGKMASSGDTKGLEAMKRAMTQTALQMERLDGYSGQATAHLKETVSSLDIIAKGTKAEERGLSSKQKQIKRLEAEYSKQRQTAAQATKSSKDATSAEKRRAKAADKAADKAEKESKDSQKAAATNANVADLTKQLRDATAKLNALQAELNKEAAAVGELASAAAACADAAKSAASAAAASVSKLNAKINECQAAIRQLRHS